MIPKLVKSKKSKQTKAGKEYSTTQLYIYFNQKDISELQLEEGKTIYLSNTPAPDLPEPNIEIQPGPTIFQLAFQELDKLFLQLAKNPKAFNFRESLTQIDISKIDKAKEVLKHE